MNNILQYVAKLHLELDKKISRGFLELDHKIDDKILNLNEQLADIKMGIATQPRFSKMEEEHISIIAELKVSNTYKAAFTYVLLYTYHMFYSGNEKPIAEQRTINGKLYIFPGINGRPTPR